MNEKSSIKLPLTVNRIAEILGGSLSGKDSATEIFRVASLENAKNNEISFVEKNEINNPINASCLIVPEDRGKDG